MMNALWHLLANSNNKQVANYLANNCSLAADNLQRCIFKASSECQPAAKYAMQGKMTPHNGIQPPLPLCLCLKCQTSGYISAAVESIEWMLKLKELFTNYELKATF